MKTSNILAAAALSLLAAAGAHAETYEGVHSVTSGYSRADVAPQAVAAARAGNVYGDNGGAASTATPVLAASVDRATIRSQAVAAAHAPGQNLRPETFAGSVIPAQAKSLSFTRQAGL
ncbi:alpha/beta hydrolase [Variovorax sp. GB1P17]|uniref:alpha/beta hydrolase n=1 Tax=Variovorax sp. GB1P17 TaxID=3443740 RepID=UPI003F48D636